MCAISHIIYRMGYQGVLVCNFTHHLQDGVSGGTCVQFHTSSMNGVSGGYLCATSHIIYKMEYQVVLVCNFTHHLQDRISGGTCVQLHTSSMRWGIRGDTCVQLHASSMRWGLMGVLVYNSTHHLQDGVSRGTCVQDGVHMVGGGYLCATSHIIYEMGSHGGTCVQLHTSSMSLGLRGIFVCNFTHHLQDGVHMVGRVLVCNFTLHL